MTYVEPGDIVFLTSDGISDNFDPVVGKFCVPKRTPDDKSGRNYAVQQNSSLPAVLGIQGDLHIYHLDYKKCLTISDVTLTPQNGRWY